MKKWIFLIVVVSILSMLFVGCTTVGAVNLPVDLNDDEKQIENIPPDKIEGIDDNKINDEEKTNQDEINVEIEIDEKNNNDKINDTANQSESENKADQDKKPDIVDSKIHYSGDGSKKLVALTFDDGPESKYTSQIMDILDQYNIKATFFVIGQNAEKYPEVLKSIHGKGHEIGNHSWSHKYFPKLSKKEVEKEILMTEELITDILGEHSALFRPPYGALKKQGIEFVNSLGYNVVNWSVDTRDWAGTSGEQMMKYVQQQLKPGGIVLMHNAGNPKSVKNTVDTLPKMIEWIKEQGYEFVTVSEILDL
ncbi:polysaccharide deacetylase family protein [Alkaliphilus sp. B6464]|uniref:polysaccharide deacetylase family protein n=1 Tax=Alkaliphilus sp. B6464 TaxID=2731219 RepID=UPI001BAE00DE|nr:polysaccharide deacetylase family protein [Alkaliphilus sp. B6464]QUH20108.1 polysaccharide deacetylase family protein [Alkaliphilus sp. B6464]